jgi:hypothetical protein
MSPAEQELQARATGAAALLLKQAAVFLEPHAPRLLFKKTMKQSIGNTTRTCILHVELPGVLRVYDAATGELLTESAPGQLDRLARRYTMPGNR